MDINVTTLDVEVDPTDEQLCAQWIHALDQAERYGKQMAWLKKDMNLEWGNEFKVHDAYSHFMNQFDRQIHHLLRQAYQSGYVTVWLSISLEEQKLWK